MRRSAFLGSVAAAGLTAARSGRARAQAPVALGGDVLLRDHVRELAGRGIGIITNQTGVTAQGVSIVDAVRRSGVRVHALFAPEHGLRGDRPAGAFVDSYVDAVSGLPVYSLYGPDRHPSAAMLAGIDVLLFDIQDVGARAYTFVSTMAYAMQSAAAHGIEFWVLDRPNPVGGAMVEGPVLDPKFSSFIGLYPIAMRHGMTIGELARMFNRHFGIGAKLRVIPMQGWQRSMIWPQTGLRWIRTSPNIPTWQTTFVYLCTGLIDSAGLNNGVGTPDPFFFAGARDLDARHFTERLSATGAPGVVFDAATWSPIKGANAGRSFSGAHLRLSEPSQFAPVRTSVELAVAARDVRASAIDVHSVREVDIDWGTDAFRKQLLGGSSANEIVASWQQGVADFLPLRQRFLLYT
jgi:uncharacterized protein YbbC (DUF1343 family)